MKHTEPDLITKNLLDELRRIITYDPYHLPNEIELIVTFLQQYTKLKQVACFDTAFHTTKPKVENCFPFPAVSMQKVYNDMVFHGISRK